MGARLGEATRYSIRRARRTTGCLLSRRRMSKFSAPTTSRPNIPLAAATLARPRPAESRRRLRRRGDRRTVRGATAHARVGAEAGERKIPRCSGLLPPYHLLSFCSDVREAAANAPPFGTILIDCHA